MKPQAKYIGTMNGVDSQGNPVHVEQCFRTIPLYRKWMGRMFVTHTRAEFACYLISRVEYLQGAKLFNPFAK